MGGWVGEAAVGRLRDRRRMLHLLPVVTGAPWSETRLTAPTVIAASATLNDGQWY